MWQANNNETAFIAPYHTDTFIKEKELTWTSWGDHFGVMRVQVWVHSWDLPRSFDPAIALEALEGCRNSRGCFGQSPGEWPSHVRPNKPSRYAHFAWWRCDRTDLGLFETHCWPPHGMLMAIWMRAMLMNWKTLLKSHTSFSSWSFQHWDNGESPHHHSCWPDTPPVVSPHCLPNSSACWLEWVGASAGSTLQSSCHLHRKRSRKMFPAKAPWWGHHQPQADPLANRASSASIAWWPLACEDKSDQRCGPTMQCPEQQSFW